MGGAVAGVAASGSMLKTDMASYPPGVGRRVWFEGLTGTRGHRGQCQTRGGRQGVSLCVLACVRVFLVSIDRANRLTNLCVRVYFGFGEKKN